MRNLLFRILVAALGIPLMLWLVLSGGWKLRVLVMVIQLGALWEWRRLAGSIHIHVPVIGLLFALAGLDVMLFSGGGLAPAAWACGGLGMLLTLETFRSDKSPLMNLGGAALFLLYVALPLGLWTRLGLIHGAHRFEPAGALLTLFFCTWMCDTGAYFVGRALGRHKLYPAASPNKTMEGLFGGIIFAAAVVPVMTLLGWILPRPMDYVALPAIVGVLGQTGDLLESLMKREAHVKDTSGILPGHGGVLDRFDSLLMSTLFFFLYLILVIR